jgi:NAD(P)-dependent dehydrogenase (short-subunit alcohol dehydrogenase family)
MSARCSASASPAVDEAAGAGDQAERGQRAARVALTSRSGERAHTAAAELGAAVIGDELDVREPASVRAGVDRVYEQLGGLDLLVNNAGIGMRTVNPRFMSEPQPFWEVAPEGFADVFATKVNGAFHVARQVVPRMLAAGGGRIVTISMNEATRVGRGFVPYGPSGAAVEALGRVIAADLAETPIRANLLAPGGATRSGMTPDDEMSDEIRAGLLDPSVMGLPIVWLASPDAANVHDGRAHRRP